MKKQIIIIASVALAAVILFTSYAIFFKDDGIDEVGDPFYTLTDDVKNALAEIENEVEITLLGYDGDDDGWEMIYLFSQAIAEANDEITVVTADGGSAVRISADSGSKEIAYDDFFKKLYDGTVYAFDGEALIANAIFSCCGKSELEISLRALSGYDTDGDVVTASGAPFVFPSVQRSDIAFLSVNNSHGSYSIYQDEGDFYFGSSRAVGYDDEMFSQVTTNCRYAVAVGKMKIPEGQSWANYGLDDPEKATASYSIMTEPDENGNYFLHTVYIGNLSSTGSYYYARYIGGLFEPSAETSGAGADSGIEASDSISDAESSDVSDSETDSDTDETTEEDGKTEGEDDKTANENGNDRLLQNLSKDIIYFISVSTVDGSICLPETDIMQPTIVNVLTNNEQILTIDNIRIDLYGDNISAIAKKQSDFNPASNLSAIDSSAISTVISDKKSAAEYSSYDGGWVNHIDVFGAFTSSDGKSTHIDAALAKTAPNGEYKIVFGLLRDEAYGAYLPSKITLSKSYDGVNWHDIENGTISVSHTDKTVKKYEFSFTDTTTVKYIRFAFDVPQKAQTYVVFDEIRIYADGDDAQPSSAVGGTWKLTAPKEYISEGMNYSFLDISNFNNFVQTMVALEGERVVACGFSNNGDATSIDKTVLAEYGLDNPDKHFGFEYQGIVTDIYASKPNEEGKYYLYSTFSGELNGSTVNATTDVIVEVSTATAEWLAWDIVEYLDHSLISIYIVDISRMEISADGKTHIFDLALDSEGQLGEVKYEGKNYDVTSFKYLYQSIIGIYMQDEYVPVEGEKAEEYFRVKIHTETNSPEIVFYRVSASKCYFTIDGQGSYYCLAEDVNDARDKLTRFINGEIITK